VRALVLQVWALLTRDRSGYLTDRWVKESAEKEAKRLAAEAMRHEVKAAE
jgi:arsenic resistance protein ArsH